MTQIGNAYALAAEVHKDQTDKAGVPYFEHVYEVARRARKSYDRIYLGEDFGANFRERVIVTAILHDVVEDLEGTSVDKQLLKERIYEQFGERVSQALEYLTHDPEVPYDIYIETLASDWIARLVKLCDLSHNLEAWRLPPGRTLEKHLETREKYNRAFVTLTRWDA